MGEGASLDDAVLGYAPSEGTKALRQAIGGFLGIDPDWIVVTLGASEAYSILVCLAARPGANIVLPHPGYPAFEPMAGVWGLGVRHVRLSRPSRNHGKHTVPPAGFTQASTSDTRCMNSDSATRFSLATA